SATTIHSIRHTRDCQVCRGQPQKEEMYVVSRHPQTTQPRCEGPTRQCRLECEIYALRGELAQARKHYPPRCDSHAIRSEGGQSARDDICVHELADRKRALQQRWPVDFPAPFGPARMTTLGCRSLTYPVRRHACLTRSSSFCWRSVTQDASRAWL